MPRLRKRLPPTPGIYLIQNKQNNKRYVGSAVNMCVRNSSHVSKLNKGGHVNKHLQSAWTKYGELEFEWSVLENIEYIEDKKEMKRRLLDREQYWIDKLNPEYNILHTAGSNLGFHHSEKTKAQISASTKGVKKSEEHAKHIAEGQKGRPLRPGEYERLMKNLEPTRHTAHIVSIIADGQEFPSIKAAADKYHICYTTAQRRLLSKNFPTWKYKDENKNKMKVE